MPESLRALLVILAIGLPVMVWSERILLAVKPQDRHGPALPRLWPAWTLVTGLAFCLPSLPLFLCLAGGVAWQCARRENVVMALYLPLLLAVPLIGVDLPTFGWVESLLSVDFSAVLAGLLLVPMWMRPHQGSAAVPPATRRFVQAYLVWLIVLSALVASFTGVLRLIVSLLLTSYLPFAAAQRSAVALENLHRILARYVVIAAVLAALGVFEYGKTWLLYASLPNWWGSNSGLLHYLERASSLRAQTTTGQPIVLGFVLALALVAALSPALYAQPGARRRGGLLALLGAGLFATVSRGPWVGAAAGALMYALLGKGGVTRAFQYLLLLVAGLFVLAVLPGGEKLIDLLPWIGKADTGSTEYRANLFNVLTPALLDSPVFGIPDYNTRPEFNGLRQGEHIIDLVNTYLEVAVASGLVGLFLYLTAHALALRGVYRRMRQETGRNAELLRTMLAVHCTALFILATTSDISVIAPLTWILLGLAAGCVVQAPRSQPRRAVHATVLAGLPADAPSGH